MASNLPTNENETLAPLKTKIDQDYILKFLKENLQMVIIAIVVVLSGIGGYSIYRFIETKNQNMMAKNLFDFKTHTWHPFQEGKVSEADLKTNFDSLLKVSKDPVQLLPIVMEMADFLIEKGENEEAVAGDMVRKAYEIMPKSSVAYYYLSTYQATFLEDSGKVDDAINLLETLLSSQHKYLEAKIYFDLGRLYAKKGDKEKAKINFQYIIENFFQNSLAKMAKIYLQRL